VRYQQPRGREGHPGTGVVLQWKWNEASPRMRREEGGTSPRHQVLGGLGTPSSGRLRNVARRGGGAERVPYHRLSSSGTRSQRGLENLGRNLRKKKNRKKEMMLVPYRLNPPGLLQEEGKKKLMRARQSRENQRRRLLVERRMLLREVREVSVDSRKTALSKKKKLQKRLICLGKDSNA